MLEEQVYDSIGEGGFYRLVAAFYRQVPDDSILGPMYPAADLPGAERRMRHVPFRIDQAARDRWMQLMTTALDETQLPPEADAVLRHFFDGMSSFMMNS